MIRENQNPNNLFPSIYRIINPVVNRVVSGSNTQFLNEDVLNNMVDTVYNIVEGQVDLEDEQETQNTRSSIDERTVNTTNNTSTSNTNTRNTADTRDTRTSANNITTTSNTNSNINASTTSSSRRNRNDSLLRDLIKILILRELLSRNRNLYQTQPFYNQNYMQQPGFYQNF